MESDHKYIYSLEIIKKALARKFSLGMEELIARLMIFDKDSQVRVFRENINIIIKNAKIDHQKSYDDFKSKHLSDPEWTKKIINKINILLKKLYTEDKILSKLTPEEVYLSVLIHVGRKLWECSYIFILYNISNEKRAKNKYKISKKIYQGTTEGIEDIISKVIIGIDYDDRIKSTKMITIDCYGDKKIHIPEEKLLEIAREKGFLVEEDEIDPDQVDKTDKEEDEDDKEDDQDDKVDKAEKEVDPESIDPVLMRVFKKK